MGDFWQSCFYFLCSTVFPFSEMGGLPGYVSCPHFLSFWCESVSKGLWSPCTSTLKTLQFILAPSMQFFQGDCTFLFLDVNIPLFRGKGQKDQEKN